MSMHLSDDEGRDEDGDDVMSAQEPQGAGRAPDSKRRPDPNIAKALNDVAKALSDQGALSSGPANVLYVPPHGQRTPQLRQFAVYGENAVAATQQIGQQVHRHVTETLRTVLVIMSGAIQAPTEATSKERLQRSLSKYIRDAVGAQIESIVALYWAREATQTRDYFDATSDADKLRDDARRLGVEVKSSKTALAKADDDRVGLQTYIAEQDKQMAVMLQKSNALKQAARLTKGQVSKLEQDGKKLHEVINTQEGLLGRMQTHVEELERRLDESRHAVLEREAAIAKQQQQLHHQEQALGQAQAVNQQLAAQLGQRQFAAPTSQAALQRALVQQQQQLTLDYSKQLGEVAPVARDLYQIAKTRGTVDGQDLRLDIRDGADTKEVVDEIRKRGILLDINKVKQLIDALRAMQAHQRQQQSEPARLMPPELLFVLVNWQGNASSDSKALAEVPKEGGAGDRVTVSQSALLQYVQQRIDAIRKSDVAANQDLTKRITQVTTALATARDDLADQLRRVATLQIDVGVQQSLADSGNRAAKAAHDAAIEAEAEKKRVELDLAQLRLELAQARRGYEGEEKTLVAAKEALRIEFEKLQKMVADEQRKVDEAEQSRKLLLEASETALTVYGELQKRLGAPDEKAEAGASQLAAARQQVLAGQSSLLTLQQQLQRLREFSAQLARQNGHLMILALRERREARQALMLNERAKTFQAAWQAALLHWQNVYEQLQARQRVDDNVASDMARFDAAPDRLIDDDVDTLVAIMTGAADRAVPLARDMKQATELPALPPAPDIKAIVQQVDQAIAFQDQALSTELARIAGADFADLNKAIEPRGPDRFTFPDEKYSAPSVFKALAPPDAKAELVPYRGIPGGVGPRLRMRSGSTSSSDSDDEPLPVDGQEPEPEFVLQPTFTALPYSQYASFIELYDWLDSGDWDIEQLYEESQKTADSMRLKWGDLLTDVPEAFVLRTRVLPVVAVLHGLRGPDDDEFLRSIHMPPPGELKTAQQLLRYFAGSKADVRLRSAQLAAEMAYTDVADGRVNLDQCIPRHILRMTEALIECEVASRQALVYLDLYKRRKQPDELLMACTYLAAVAHNLDLHILQGQDVYGYLQLVVSKWRRTFDGWCKLIEQQPEDERVDWQVALSRAKHGHDLEGQLPLNQPLLATTAMLRLEKS